MRIYSLKVRDDAKKDPGCAVVELSGLELIALNNILSKTSKGAKRDYDCLAGMVCVTYTANALVQHGGLDSVDILALSEVDERLHRHQGGEENAQQ